MTEEKEHLTHQGLYDLVMKLDKQDQTKFDNGKIKKAEVHRIIDSVFEAITQTVSEGKEVRLTGFGTFKPFLRQAREGRNPRTGESLEIPTKWVPKFSAGSKFKDQVAKSIKD